MKDTLARKTGSAAGARRADAGIANATLSRLMRRAWPIGLKCPVGSDAQHFKPLAWPRTLQNADRRWTSAPLRTGTVQSPCGASLINCECRVTLRATGAFIPRPSYIRGRTHAALNASFLVSFIEGM